MLRSAYTIAFSMSELSTLKMAMAVFFENVGRTLSIQCGSHRKSDLFKFCYVFMAGMTSANYTTSSPSWVYYHGSPGSSHSIPRNRSQQSSPGSQPSNISFVDVIENEHSLQQYLQDYENFERTAAVGNYCLKSLSCFLHQNIWKILIKMSAGSVCPVHSWWCIAEAELFVSWNYF